MAAITVDPKPCPSLASAITEGAAWTQSDSNKWTTLVETTQLNFHGTKLWFF